jgi:hypothetical protein
VDKAAQEHHMKRFWRQSGLNPSGGCVGNRDFGEQGKGKQQYNIQGLINL